MNSSTPDDAETTYGARMTAMVTRYATPLALLLVVIGLLSSRPGSPEWEICLGLIAFGVIFNMMMVGILRRRPEKSKGIIKLRLLTNVTINIALLYFLFEFFPPIWLVLVLTPFATAIYADRKQTLSSALGISMILLVVSAMKGIDRPSQWGEVLARALFIVCMSLLINELSSIARENRG